MTILEQQTQAAASPGVTDMAALHLALMHPYLTTEEAANVLRVQPQTLRKAWSQRGAYGTLKPFKVKASRRLYWKTEEVRRLIEGAV